MPRLRGCVCAHGQSRREARLKPSSMGRMKERSRIGKSGLGEISYLEYSGGFRWRRFQKESAAFRSSRAFFRIRGGTSGSPPDNWKQAIAPPGLGRF